MAQKPITSPNPGTEGQLEDIPKTKGDEFGGGPRSTDDDLGGKDSLAKRGQLGNADPSVPGPFRRDDRKAS